MSGPRVRVVLQARTSSSRLPAKVLLPLGGLPLIVLAARRVSSSRHELVVATSTEPSDDRLAAVLADAGLTVVRGSLDDVLGRFVDAVSDLGDEDVVVRLTGDNPVPDREVVETLVDEFVESGLDYLKLSDELPYGLAAAAFTAGALRRADAATDDPADREHVTSWLRRELRSGASTQRFGIPEGSTARCTVDTLEEYLAMAAAVARVDDPVGVPAQELVAALAEPIDAPPRPGRGGPVTRMSLGGAQLGLAYGRLNTAGKPDRASAVALVHRALAAGVTTFDTARAYGDSEAVLGEALAGAGAAVRVITKVAPLAPDAPPEAVEASVLRSLHELRTRRLDTVLLHRASDITADGGRRWDRLRSLAADGLVRTLGASVQSPDELELALATPGIEVVQVPYHVLDRRWDRWLRAADPPDVEIHVRSVFLQGLLAASGTERWPSVAGVEPQELIDALDGLVERFGRVDRADLCVAFVQANPAVSRLVLGVDTPEQLLANAELVRRPPLEADQVAEVERAFAALPEDLLNPALWPR